MVLAAITQHKRGAQSRSNGESRLGGGLDRRRARNTQDYWSAVDAFELYDVKKQGAAANSPVRTVRSGVFVFLPV